MLFRLCAIFSMHVLMFFCWQKDVPKKTKSKRKNIPVNECPVGALSQSDLQKAVEQEYEMALQDRVMEETKDKKNAVEAYVYDMRNKVLILIR